ncbi:hypothetical protein GUF72_16810 [Xanthomonas citri pv. citri]|uniref:Uncharacterized protein n=2 Tax=Xanthomonas citri pv. citri TaxID=611301 RepID=A0AAI7ZHJ4_XANAC|nr:MULTISPECIES: hypothetical protein [Xanthomonas]AAM38168.1 hypothetical protein XAC3325 [Xanthomonas citri pv. citri str. 306]AKM26255.1 hypothetical protein AB890_16780 [Xanthomonas citri pv. citri]APR09981.1 hypothetical protein BI314_07095 [Xanthomonas citri pv. citri]APR14772.1 hypothetical protein BI315_07800 [Xanthomonas citri pv. citri]APR21324.1 hypothetical protein BI316_19185 [Xanthomonas citri pv. citri]
MKSTRSNLGSNIQGSQREAVLQSGQTFLAAVNQSIQKAHMTDLEEKLSEQSHFGSRLRQGEPILLAGDYTSRLVGFSMNSVSEGEIAHVRARAALTSDAQLFHKVVESLEGVITHAASKQGVAINLRQASTILMIVKPDNSFELWVDAAAVALNCRIKRSLAAESAVFEQDIADITHMQFPLVEIGERDGVLCLFREAWAFGLAFDFNVGGALDREQFERDLGSLYRVLRYRHIYEVMDNPATMAALRSKGWFPFAEIITSEFRQLASYVASGFDITKIEADIVEAFDDERLNWLLERWNAKPHFVAKQALLEEAIQAFKQRRPVAVIKILLTEIEGILRDAYRAKNEGKNAKVNTLLEFAREAGERSAGAPDTLLFAHAFREYMHEYIFANFDPMEQSGEAGSRHAVGHGAATQESYTMTRALQAILTLDQLAFYT